MQTSDRYVGAGSWLSEWTQIADELSEALLLQALTPCSARMLARRQDIEYSNVTQSAFLKLLRENFTPRLKTYTEALSPSKL